MAEEERGSGEEPVLSAELAIAKSRVLNLERENRGLRREKSLFWHRMAEQRSELERRIDLSERAALFRETERFFLGSVGSQPAARDGIADPGAVDPLLGLFKENGRDLKGAIASAITAAAFRSADCVRRLTVLRDYFFDDFHSVPPERVIRAAEEARLYGKPFVEVFLLFCHHRAVFEFYWERFFGLPFFIREKRDVLLSVPTEWVVARMGDGADGAPNSLRRFVAENNALLYEFFILVAERRPAELRRFLAQATYDDALRRDDALAAGLVRAVCAAGGLGYAAGDCPGAYTPEMLRACFGGDYPAVLEPDRLGDLDALLAGEAAGPQE